MSAFNINQDSRYR